MTQQAAKREAEFWDAKGKFIEKKLKAKGRKINWQTYNDELYKRIDTAASLGKIKRELWEDKVLSEAAREVKENYEFDTKKKRSYII